MFNYMCWNNIRNSKKSKGLYKLNDDEGANFLARLKCQMNDF